MVEPPKGSEEEKVIKETSGPTKEESTKEKKKVSFPGAVVAGIMFVVGLLVFFYIFFYLEIAGTTFNSAITGILSPWLSQITDLLPTSIARFVIGFLPFWVLGLFIILEFLFSIRTYGLKLGNIAEGLKLSIYYWAWTVWILDIILFFIWLIFWGLQTTGSISVQCLSLALQGQIDISKCMGGGEVQTPKGTKSGSYQVFNLKWGLDVPNYQFPSPLSNLEYSFPVIITNVADPSNDIDNVIIGGIVTNESLEKYTLNKIVKMTSACNEIEPCKILAGSSRKITLDSEGPVPYKEGTYASVQATIKYPFETQGDNEFYIVKSEIDSPTEKTCSLNRKVSAGTPCMGTGPLDVVVWFSSDYYVAGSKNNKLHMYISIINNKYQSSAADLKSLSIVRYFSLPELEYGSCSDMWGNTFKENEIFENFETSLHKKFDFTCNYTLPTSIESRFISLKFAVQIKYEYTENFNYPRKVAVESF